MPSSAIVDTLDFDAAELLDKLTAIVATASATILDMRANPGARTKADGSPVTAADEAAEAIILEGLAQAAPGLPVVSEEQTTRAAPVRGASHILVDPLDGTKEFIAGRDEFTVNIAILTAGVPVIGIVSAPALGLAWRGIVGRGAARLALAGGTPVAIRTRKRRSGELLAAVSRSHLEDRTRAFLARFTGVKPVQSGSSIKFCRVAEGAADVYPRLAPTHDWDIAAGHAVLAAAGGSVVTPSGGQLAYGTPELLIPGFIAWGDPASAAGIKE
jgi:3'(2'), 5'-bisphosphate nucleotidase